MVDAEQRPFSDASRNPAHRRARAQRTDRPGRHAGKPRSLDQPATAPRGRDRRRDHGHARTGQQQGL